MIEQPMLVSEGHSSIAAQTQGVGRMPGPIEMVIAS